MDRQQFNEETGRKPSEVISNTAEHQPTPGTTFWLLYCITATQIAAATLCNVRNIATTTYPAGAFIYGRFSRVTLTSGSVQAFETAL